MLTVITEGPVARRIAELSEGERRKAILDGVAERFGDKALSPIDYVEQNPVRARIGRQFWEFVVPFAPVVW